MNFKQILSSCFILSCLFSLNAHAIRSVNVRDAAEDLLFHTEPSIELAKQQAVYVDVPETDPRKKEPSRTLIEAQEIADRLVEEFKEKAKADKTNALLKRAITIGELYSELPEGEQIPYSFILESVSTKLD